MAEEPGNMTKADGDLRPDTKSYNLQMAPQQDTGHGK